MQEVGFSPFDSVERAIAEMRDYFLQERTKENVYRECCIVLCHWLLAVRRHELIGGVLVEFGSFDADEFPTVSDFLQQYTGEVANDEPRIFRDDFVDFLGKVVHFLGNEFLKVLFARNPVLADEVKGELREFADTADVLNIVIFQIAMTDTRYISHMEGVMATWLKELLFLPMSLVWELGNSIAYQREDIRQAALLLNDI